MSENKPKVPPPASGVRQHWQDIPESIRTQIENWLGSSVVSNESQTLGFSPGVAARIETEDGQRVFVKAIGTDINPTSVNFHRREAAITKFFPKSAPVPELFWTLDDKDDTGWVVLIFQNIDGYNPPTPWHDDDLKRVMATLEALPRALQSVTLPPDLRATAKERFATAIRGWNLIQNSLDTDNPMPVDDWVQRHFSALIDLENQAAEAVQGDAILHFDIRADNLLITDEQVWVIDFPHACVGADWLDIVLFAPSVTMQGGMLPDDLLKLSPVCQAADPDAITATVVAYAGFLTHRSLLPAPAGLPTLRPFQAAMAATLREWIIARTGLE